MVHRILQSFQLVFLCLKPGIDKVLRVINKLVKEIVVLTPAKITEMTAISCEPKPVYFNLDENGVINVHPAIVREAFGHCTTKVVLTFSEEKELKKKSSQRFIIFIY